MNRRNFLKALCIAPAVPSVLCAKAHSDTRLATEEDYQRYLADVINEAIDWDKYNKFYRELMITGRAYYRPEDFIKDKYKV